MSQATIHIGLPKTGTTSIQRFLRVNADNLEAHGFRYPRFLERENHLQLAIYGVGRDGVHMAEIAGIQDVDHWLSWRSGFRERFLEATATDGHWLFSSEHISSRLTNTERITRLGSLLREAFTSLRIIIYLRRQDEMAISSYSTWVRDGRHEPFEIQKELENENRYDFRQIVKRWQSIFSNDEVRVRLYPPKQASTSLLDDFSIALGLPAEVRWEIPPRLNTTLSAVELEYLRMFNRLVPRLDSRGRPVKRYGNPARFVQGGRPGPAPQLDQEQAGIIMKKYQDSNRWVLGQVDSPFADDEYFAVNEATEDPASRTQDLTIEDAMQLSARLWKRLMDEYNDVVDDQATSSSG